MYVRTVKVPSSNGSVNRYVGIVEAYREGGKVKQRTIADLGRKDVLAALLPQLERVIRGDAVSADQPAGDVTLLDAATWGPVLVVRALFGQLGLWELLERHRGRTRQVSPADRAFVLIAKRLIHPASEHGLALTGKRRSILGPGGAAGRADHPPHHFPGRGAEALGREHRQSPSSSGAPGVADHRSEASYPAHRGADRGVVTNPKSGPYLPRTYGG